MKRSFDALSSETAFCSDYDLAPRPLEESLPPLAGAHREFLTPSYIVSVLPKSDAIWRANNIIKRDGGGPIFSNRQQRELLYGVLLSHRFVHDTIGDVVYSADQAANLCADLHNRC